jgi:hypothetical protein
MLNEAQKQRLLLCGIGFLVLLLVFNIMEHRKLHSTETPKMSREDSIASHLEAVKANQRRSVEGASEIGSIVFSDVQWVTEFHNIEYLYNRAQTDSLSSQIEIEKSGSTLILNLVDDDKHYMITIDRDSHNEEHVYSVISPGVRENIPNNISITHYVTIGKVVVLDSEALNKQTIINDASDVIIRFVMHSKK